MRRPFCVTLFAVIAATSSQAEDRDLRVAEPPESLRQALQLDPFYQKCVMVEDLAVVSSRKVSEHALLEAAYLVRQMLDNRGDLRRALVRQKVRVSVMAPDEFTTTIPEHRDLRPAQYWNKRARGLGATRVRPAVSCGEENLLQFPGDPYQGESILVHEFAHAIHEMGLKEIDATFDGRLGAAYDEAMREGLWKGTYAATNRSEYWAEGVQSWFDCNRRNDAQHNDVATREALEKYDPRLAKLLGEVFKDNKWRYVRPDQRADPGHLKGFDRDKVPRFSWPKELLEWNERNHGNSVIRRKAGASEIVVKTEARMAGAITSLTWNGKQFLDSADHGRLLQSAANFDCEKKFVPETFNPTEAGSRRDGAGDRSSSKLYRFQAEGRRLEAITQMAFWLAPDEKTPDGAAALNDKVLSEHRLCRRMQIGYKELPHAIEYEVTFVVPEGERHTYAQFEAVTGYMPPEFGAFWKHDLASGKLLPLDDGPGEQALPVVLATENGSHAMGVFSPDQPSKGYETAGYGRFRFPAEKVNKWNCVFRVRDDKGITPGRYSYRTFVVVGSLDDVRQTLKGLVGEFRRPD